MKLYAIGFTAGVYEMVMRFGGVEVALYASCWHSIIEFRDVDDPDHRMRTTCLNFCN